MDIISEGQNIGADFVRNGWKIGEPALGVLELEERNTSFPMREDKRLPQGPRILSDEQLVANFKTIIRTTPVRYLCGGRSQYS
jgi:hypothetical protein